MGICRCWVEEVNNDYYVATSKSLEVEPGYYYRVHADHIVQEGDDPPEETFSVTDGIFIRSGLFIHDTVNLK